MNIASSSGSGPLPSNTIANPKGELKAITTRSGLVLVGPFVPMPPLFINPEEDERVEETLMDPELAEYTIKVPPPFVQKSKPPSLRNYVVHQRDPRYPHIPYSLRMNQEKQQEKDEIQILKFWQMFKQLHINITLADALILISKPFVPMPPLFINPEEDERVEETLTDPELAEYTIKVPPPFVQKSKPPSLRNYVVHQRDPRYPHIPYPLRMNQEKQQEKDEIQILKFWQMFKQLHINITLADALILIS
nr:hypothetical protein [Tanacetum cinerariifolium]